MNEYSLYANFSGENFYPSKSIEKFDGFIVTDINDRGEKIQVTGGGESGYKFGYVGLQPREPFTNDVGIFARFFRDLIKLKSELGTDDLDIVVSLEIGYENKCNFELSPNEIKLLRTLNATFTISCYQRESGSDA
jgi:hypothetical protein